MDINWTAVSAGVAVLGVFTTIVLTREKHTRDETNERRKTVDQRLDVLEKDVSNMRLDVGNVRLDMAAGDNNVRSDAGEMGSALRAKIHEFETWTRDELVSKDTFELVVGRMERSMEKGFDKLERKFDESLRSMMQALGRRPPDTG